jgi:hypothetical protein
MMDSHDGMCPFSSCKRTSVPARLERQAPRDESRARRTRVVQHPLAWEPAILCNTPRPGRRRREPSTVPSHQSELEGRACAYRFSLRLAGSLRRSNVGFLAQVLLLFLAVFCTSGVHGADLRGRGHYSGRLARRGGLLVDLIRPVNPADDQMERRAAAASTTSYEPILPTFTLLSGTGSATTTTTAEASAATSILPQVFDSNLGNNFTNAGCPSFFNKLRTSSNFQSCYPFSLLLTVCIRCKDLCLQP